jgi:hypothetical protein
VAGSRIPGPVCQVENPVEIDDGTSCLAATASPGPVSLDNSPLASADGQFTSEYDIIKADLGTLYDGVSETLQSNYEGARCLFQACQQAQDLAPAAIYKETGYELGQLLQGLIPGLLQMIVIVGATTLLGAAVGGIVGFFFGGVGAAPGAAIGGELGLDVGMAVLTWLGVAFLAVSIVKGFGEMLEALRNGVEWAWYARNLKGPAEEKQVNRAAQELARTVGILVRLILQGIVAYLLKKAAVGATRGAMATGRALQTDGAAAVSEATVADLVGKLRASKLGKGFADWVEKNWRDMVKNQRLRASTATKATAGSEAADTGDAATDDAPKPKKEPAARKTEEELVPERRATAQQFYEQQGWDQKRIAAHMKGIDFSKPVKVVTLEAGTQVSQWQTPGEPQGNYYAEPGTDPSTLGINPEGKVEQQFVVTKPVKVLQSTAADIPDWAGSGKTWTGGATQNFTTDSSAFQPL